MPASPSPYASAPGFGQRPGGPQLPVIATGSQGQAPFPGTYSQPPPGHAGTASLVGLSSPSLVVHVYMEGMCMCVHVYAHVYE